MTQFTARFTARCIARLGAVLGAIALTPAAGADPNPAECPLHAQHSHQAMLAQGAVAMGFDPLRTSHHFRLSRQGGVIEVHVHDARDTELRDQVTRHLREIAAQFAAGDFETPFAVHGETPPGVADLSRLRSALRYEFEAGDLGGRVRISTQDPAALAALHEFLRYQIREHRTGDSPAIEGR